MWKASCMAGAAALLVCGTAVGRDLPLGETIEDETTDSRPAEYDFVADGAGVLTIVVRADGDVAISVLDENDELVPDGRIDDDYEDNGGAEQRAIVLSEEGEYRVVIESLGFEASFVLGAMWLPIDEVARPEDPQGNPDEAIAMEVGETYRGEIEPVIGDERDWFRFEAEEDGRLTVATRSREGGDIVLEAYSEDDFESAIEYSDQDIDDDWGHESISIDIEEGDVIYFVVSTNGDDAEYRIRAVLTDD